jgi:hypothetical protein
VSSQLFALTVSSHRRETYSLASEHFVPRDVLVAYRDGGRVGMPTITDGAERWRALASEARNTAIQMTDAEAKRALLFIAAAYERLAHGAQKRQEQKK